MTKGLKATSKVSMLVILLVFGEGANYTFAASFNVQIINKEKQNKQPSDKLQYLLYPDGAADKAVSVVNFENSFEQLVTSHLICSHLTLQQIHRL